MILKKGKEQTLQQKVTAYQKKIEKQTAYFDKVNAKLLQKVRYS